MRLPLNQDYLALDIGKGAQQGARASDCFDLTAHRHW